MKVTPKQHARVLYELCKKVPASRMDDITKEYVVYFAKRGKAKLLPGIAQELEKYLSFIEGTISIEVATAHPLDDQTLTHIKNVIKKSSKKEPAILMRHDAKLIAGIRIKAGHTVIDASIRSYLQQLKEHILVS